MTTLWLATALPVAVLLLFPAAAVGAKAKCPGFPYFKNGARSFIEGAKFKSVAFDEETGHSELELLLLPALEGFVDMKRVRECFKFISRSHHGWNALKFKLTFEVKGDDGFHSSSSALCYYIKIQELSEDPIMVAYLAEFRNKVGPCGTYNISLWAKTRNGRVHHLGTTSEQLPTHSPLRKTAETMTSVTIGFSKTFSKCWPTRSYVLECENVKRKMTQEDTLVMENLFPVFSWNGHQRVEGYYYCELNLKEGCDRIQDPECYLGMLFGERGKGQHSEATFSYNDHQIRLVSDKAFYDHVLKNPNFTARVTVKDLETGKESINVSGVLAEKNHVFGLFPNHPYKACLYLANKKGTCLAECSNKTMCNIFTTLPANSSRKKQVQNGTACKLDQFFNERGQGWLVVAEFSLNDHGIILGSSKAFIDQVLKNPNFTARVTVNDLETGKELFNVSGIMAARSGVFVLRPSHAYEACLHLANSELIHLAKCSNKTICKMFATLPAKSPGESSVAVWAVFSLLALLAFCVAILGLGLFLVWRRLPAQLGTGVIKGGGVGSIDGGAITASPLRLSDLDDGAAVNGGPKEKA